MTSRLAIIGAGVRGTAALGRLVARLRDSADPRPIEVHVVDPFPAGAGRIWRHEQSHSLVMNTVAAQSTVFDDASLGFAASMPGPSFAEWCAEVAEGRIDVDDPWTRRSASAIVPWASPPRALYGRYLSWAFERFANALPARVRLIVHASRAIALRRRPEGYRLELLDGTTISVDAALLALGWLPRAQGPGVDILPDSPIDQGIEAIGAGERVAVRGIGMGFVDLLSLVTEARGGAFEPAPAPGRPGALRYLPSGEEPRLFAGSRSGLPLLAKPAFGTIPPPARFSALDTALPALLRRRPLDFAREVLPLVEHEAAAEHYRALSEVRPGAFRGDPRLLLDAFDLSGPALDPRRPHDPAETLARIDAWRAPADSLVPDPSNRFAPDRLGEAPRGADTRDFDAATVARIEADAREAALGYGSPRKRGLHVYQAGRSAIIPLTDFGGVVAGSRGSLDRYLELAGIAGSGPPLFRVEQLLALHGAGIVRFLGPRLEILERDGRRAARSALASDQGVEIDRVVDARLDLPDPTKLHDPLLDSLLDAGLARLSPGETDRPTLEISPSDSALIMRDGEPAPGLHSVGPLHEQLRRFTIIAPIPGARSTVLKEIDASIAAMLDQLRELAPATPDPYPASLIEERT